VGQFREIKRSALHVLKNISPTLFYLFRYHRATKKLVVPREERDKLYTDFVSSVSGQGLQIAVKDDAGGKFGDNWVSVDKYDQGEHIDYNYDVHDMPFEDASFDAVVCVSVLEHVTHPQDAIAELRRVLKPGGKIFVQLPFQFHYHADPDDFWRASPAGLRLWMQNFEELACGNFRFTRSSLATSTYFMGTKPLTEA